MLYGLLLTVGTPAEGVSEAADACATVEVSNGTEAALRAAQARARQAMAGSRGAQCVEVQLGSHRFELSTPLELTAADSHTQYVGKSASISGAVSVPASALAPLSLAQQKLFKPTVVDNVRAISLTSLGVNPGHLKPLAYAGGNACIMANVYRALGAELFDGQHQMRMARWPQVSIPPAASDWAHIVTANSSTNPQNWSSVAVALNNTDQLKRWQEQVARGGQVYTHGLWEQNWADTHRRIEQVSEFATGANGTFARLALGHACDAVPKASIEDWSCDGDAEVTSGNTHGGQGGHFYVYNALYELDSPGEYAIDHGTATVFVWPISSRAGTVKRSGLYVTNATTLVTGTGAQNISFRGVDFSGSRGSAVVLKDCRDVVIRDGLIRQVGLNAFNVSGGQRCGLSNVSVSLAGTFPQNYGSILTVILHVNGAPCCWNQAKAV